MKQSFPKGTVLVTIILMDLLSGMEFDIFVPSFPELQNQFSLSPFQVESLLSVNFIGFCLSLFFVGALSDRYGRKPIILIGLIIFIIGSIFCLWALSYESLLFGRFLQGIGIAAPSILCFLIIADSYPIEKQQSLMALLNGLMNLAVGGAPVAGSYITMYFHWQGNFATLLVLGIVVLILTIFFIPKAAVPEHKEPVSLKGYIPIFQSKTLMILIINFIFIFVPYWIFVGMSPLLYMQDLGVSLAHFGYYQGAICAVYGVGSILYGLIMHKIDQRKFLYYACLIWFISLILILYVAVGDIRDPLLITLIIILFCIGQISTTSLFPLCLNYMPHMKAKVSALIQGGRLIVSALSLGLAGHFYQGNFQNIGIIIAAFIFLATIFLLFVLSNREIIKAIKLTP